MELAVIDIKGKETGAKVSLDDAIFGIEASDHAIYLEIKQYLAAQRQGTHKSKERADIAGSTRKIKKQKGTGTARAGSIKSPIFRGGGRIFGPRPRDYSFKLNKAQKRLAKKSVLTQKAKENNIKVLQDFTLDAPKTKDLLAILDALGLTDKKALFVLGESNKNVYLSSRNLKKAKIVNYTELSSYDILNASELILLESSVSKLQELLSK